MESLDSASASLFSPSLRTLSALRSMNGDDSYLRISELVLRGVKDEVERVKVFEAFKGLGLSDAKGGDLITASPSSKSLG